MTFFKAISRNSAGGAEVNHGNRHSESVSQSVFVCWIF
jgi:hypothetical protein